MKAENMNRRLRLFLTTARALIVGIVVGLSTDSRADTCDQQLAVWSENVIYTYTRNNGDVVVVEDGIDSPLTGSDDVGDVIRRPVSHHNGAHGLVPCLCGMTTNYVGACYERFEVNIETGFEFQYQHVYEDWSGDPVYESVTINKDNINLFYDIMYAGYTRNGDVDFSMNCHGYACGVGDWPNDFNYGAGIIINEPVCYTRTGPPLVDVAYSGGHSIIVEGGICIDEHAAELPFHLAITRTVEKFRASRRYEQVAACDAGGVNVAKAHAGSGATFLLFRENP
jgi:hypothetical protein